MINSANQSKERIMKVSLARLVAFFTVIVCILEVMIAHALLTVKDKE